MYQEILSVSVTTQWFVFEVNLFFDWLISRLGVEKVGKMMKWKYIAKQTREPLTYRKCITVFVQGRKYISEFEEWKND